MTSSSVVFHMVDSASDLSSAVLSGKDDHVAEVSEPSRIDVVSLLNGYRTRSRLVVGGTSAIRPGDEERVSVLSGEAVLLNSVEGADLVLCDNRTSVGSTCEDGASSSDGESESSEFHSWFALLMFQLYSPWWGLYTVQKTPITRHIAAGAAPLLQAGTTLSWNSV